ncbi:hypothetical protein TELCIR_07845 [Teladorsagia circumcincta]|uniref:Uncharacterized protein n=1 Tax=Teladorsagia circumcincta TaxID=45464 RepID=A0A2G9UJ77_TELCI|nr:hypothetical protein TELCIR_07845 [Teladorsagia circumcincta]
MVVDSRNKDIVNMTSWIVQLKNLDLSGHNDAFTVDIHSTSDDCSPRSLAKRGGARAFHGYYNMPSSKRISGAYPYYFYEKRGGGRAFVGGWQPYEYSLGSRMERRGGGRAFNGWRGPSEYYSRFYDNPYYKRSSSLWEFLEDRNAI